VADLSLGKDALQSVIVPVRRMQIVT